MKAHVGDKIRIVGFKEDSDGKIYDSEKRLIGKEGYVEYIDGAGNLHGTWGSLGILPEDKYEILETGNWATMNGKEND